MLVCLTMHFETTTHTNPKRFCFHTLSCVFQPSPTKDFEPKLYASYQDDTQLEFKNEINQNNQDYKIDTIKERINNFENNKKYKVSLAI